MYFCGTKYWLWGLICCHWLIFLNTSQNDLLLQELWVHCSVIAKELPDRLRFFSNFQRFWYQKKAHIFLITPGEFYSWKIYRLEDIDENVTSYGNHNYVYTQGIGNCKIGNLFCIQTVEPISLKFETKIYLVMTHHFHSGKSDQAPLSLFSSCSIHVVHLICEVLDAYSIIWQRTRWQFQSG